MRVIFLGSPEFGLKALEQLMAKHEIIAVVTQPDSEQGRGQKLQSCPVAVFAKKNNLKLLQFEKISRDGVEIIKELKPDIMVTCAYGQILSQEIIDIPRYGIINVHGSILPKYRGASPIQSAIINGEVETGITIMQTEAGLDSGDIIKIKTTPIFPDETAGELSERLSVIGADLLIEAMNEIGEGKATFIKQRFSDATFTTKLNKTNCTINFEKTAEQIKNLVRGSNPDPIARTLLNQEQIKIYKVKVRPDIVCEEQPGTIIPLSNAKNGLLVACGMGVLEIVELQFPGGKVISGQACMNGRKVCVGDRFEAYSDAVH